MVQKAGGSIATSDQLASSYPFQRTAILSGEDGKVSMMSFYVLAHGLWFVGTTYQL
jgi:hypothetical protein